MKNWQVIENIFKDFYNGNFQNLPNRIDSLEGIVFPKIEGTETVLCDFVIRVNRSETYRKLFPMIPKFNFIVVHIDPETQIIIETILTFSNHQQHSNFICIDNDNVLVEKERLDFYTESLNNWLMSEVVLEQKI